MSLSRSVFDTKLRHLIKESLISCFRISYSLLCCPFYLSCLSFPFCLYGLSYLFCLSYPRPPSSPPPARPPSSPSSPPPARPPSSPPPPCRPPSWPPPPPSSPPCRPFFPFWRLCLSWTLPVKTSQLHS